MDLSASVAQSAVRSAVNRKVSGSSPLGSDGFLFAHILFRLTVFYRFFIICEKNFMFLLIEMTKLLINFVEKIE